MLAVHKSSAAKSSFVLPKKKKKEGNLRIRPKNSLYFFVFILTDRRIFDGTGMGGCYPVIGTF